MEVTAKCAISLVLLAMLMALALSENSRGALAVTLQKNNGTTTHCSGRIDECLMAGDDLDLDFTMGLGMSRMLAGDPQYNIEGTKTASKPSLCADRGDGYHSCTPKDNPLKPGEHCRYENRNRGCPRYE